MSDQNHIPVSENTQLEIKYTPHLMRKQSGYSLIEILVAIAIIAVLATLVAPRLFGQLDRSKVTTAKTQIKMLETALDTMRLDIGRYPSQEEGLVLLVKVTNELENSWYGPYLNDAIPSDPWGNPYRYHPPDEQNGRGYVYTLGQDNSEGGSGLNADIGK